MILRSFESASKGMQALIDMNDNIANNLSNVNTTGYKKANLTFQNIYDSSVVQKTGGALSNEIRDLGELSVGSKVQKLTHDFSQGGLLKTEAPLDLALEGDGFFKLQSTDGEISYTRNGSFTMNNNSYLVTKDGEYVLDNENRRIRIGTEGMAMRSNNDIVINEQGQIEINNERNKITLQTIGVFDFSNKEDLRNVGGAQFQQTDPAANPERRAEKYVIAQGNLEMSNASVVNEMINTINTSRNYESLSKLVRTEGEMLGKVLQIGRVRLI